VAVNHLDLGVARMKTPKHIRETRTETLCERVDEAIQSHKRVLKPWMGPQAAVGELVRRDEGLEEALNEIAREVQGLAAAQKGGAAPLAERVEEIRSHKDLLQISTSSRTALGELVKRNLDLETAVRVVALETQQLAASHEA